MFGDNLLGLSSTISPFNDTQPDDVIKIKSALAQTGHYQVPDFGITPYPDTPMIDGIKKFQKDNGLKVDGVMKPQGPTEMALGNQASSISTVNPFATNQEQPKTPKPKPSKIDPLTGLPEQKAPKLKMPTAKQWEQAAEMQKPKTAIVPEGKTVNQRIQSMMSDARYQDKFDTRLRDHVQKQFEKAYTGNVQYDETGKMVQPTPVIAPDEVEPFDPDGELTAYMVSDNSQVARDEQNTSEPSITHEKVAQMLKEYKEDPEKFIRVKQANVNQSGGDVQIAAVPVLAFFPWLAGLLGVATAILAQKHYNQSTSSEQEDYKDAYQDYLDSLEDDIGDDDDENHKECRDRWEWEHQTYCKEIGDKYGTEQAGKCRNRANKRLNVCEDQGYPEPVGLKEWYPPVDDPEYKNRR